MDTSDHSNNSDKPLYIQVKNALLDYILTPDVHVGDQLPGEREIANRMRVSQMTANRAIRELVQEGYLHRKVGLGTFVLTKEPHSRATGPRINVILFSDVMIENIDGDIFLASLSRGIVDKGNQYGCDFAFLQALNPGELTPLVRGLNSERDHVLLVSPPIQMIPEVEQVYKETDVPLVVVGAHWDHPDIPFVDCDNAQGAELAIDHLVSLGHRNIVIFSAWSSHKNTLDRLEGCRKAFERHGLPHRPDLQLDFGVDDSDTSAVCDALQEFLSLPLPERPTAVFALGFRLALGVKQCLSQLEVSVPHEVSLIGFDDTLSAPFLIPPLTTIRQPLVKMGELAVQEVIHRDKQQLTLLPIEFVLRRSTDIAMR